MLVHSHLAATIRFLGSPWFSRTLKSTSIMGVPKSEFSAGVKTGGDKGGGEEGKRGKRGDRA